MSSIKPTGYQVEIEADVFWVLMRCFGKSCARERKENFGHSDELDRKAAKVWSTFNRQLQQDGYPAFDWENDDNE